MLARHKRDKLLPDGVRQRAKACTNDWVRQPWHTIAFARRRSPGSLRIIGGIRPPPYREQSSRDDALPLVPTYPHTETISERGFMVSAIPPNHRRSEPTSS
jgi:hypothetical protein